MATASVLEAPNLVRRLTATLLAGQSMASLAATGAITVGSIAATQLTGSAALAGLPTTMMVLGTALGAYPAGRLMDRYGRRFGLTLGFLIGVIGSLAGVYALIGFVPALLFLGHAVMGMARGALDQGRFAAAEIVTPEHRARAVSYVVLGGTVGGIGGPLFIGPTSRLSAQLGFDLLVGPYFAGLLLFALGVILMFAFLRPDPRDLGRHLARIRLTNAVIDNTPPRTFREALHSRNIQTAVAAMVLGQVVMVTVMVMTPLHMTEHLGHTLDAVSLVIAAHVTGMYVTSVFTGRVADRVGHEKTILIGSFLLLVACVMAPFATDVLRLSLALFTLGAGWNFCYVSGSSLLTDSLRPNERGRIQGTNDLVVGLVAAFGSLGSGFVFETVGYLGIALAGITLAVSLFGIALWALQRRVPIYSEP